jgi:uncharacterized protein Yka (UPF0111/DUF47 family)
MTERVVTTWGILQEHEDQIDNLLKAIDKIDKLQAQVSACEQKLDTLMAELRKRGSL